MLAWLLAWLTDLNSKPWNSYIKDYKNVLSLSIDQTCRAWFLGPHTHTQPRNWREMKKQPRKALKSLFLSFTSSLPPLKNIWQPIESTERRVRGQRLKCEPARACRAPSKCVVQTYLSRLSTTIQPIYKSFKPKMMQWQRKQRQPKKNARKVKKQSKKK